MKASTADVSQTIERVQGDGVKLSRNGGTTPNENGEERSIETIRADGQSPLASNGAPLQKSSSKSSQTDLPAEASVVLDGVVDKTFQNAARPQASSGDSFVPAKDLESNRIKNIVESRPGSPGVDPKKAVPPSAEDIGNLPGPILFGANDENHKAATAHLPPKRAQETRLEEVDKARGEKDDRDGQTLQNSLRVVADLASSPGSTIGAHSATTPALHEASTETSPENNGSRYDDLDRLEKDNEARTPPELKQSQEDLARKDELERIQKAQIEVSRAEILASSPTAADTQLRLEDEAASTTQAPPTGTEVADSEAAGSQESGASNTLPKGRNSDTVKESVERTNDEAHAPTPKTNPLAGVPNPKQSEVPDSEGEAQTPLDPMDVDTAVVEDALESKPSVDNIPSLDANASAPTDQEITKQTDDAKASSTTPISTPRRTSSATTALPLERMTTRVASGAIRHKSVSEILGETPASPTSVRSSATRADNGTTSNSPSRASTPQSPRSLIQKAKEKERSRLSTVVFAKKPNVITNDSVSVQPGGGAAPPKPHDDYFMSLYLNGHSSQRTGIQPLDSLLQTAHKTITTSNAYVPIIENQTTRILKRIYNLQSAHKWSLRQPKRSEEPIRQTTHWDVLLQEAKWMRTDFREERKWKMAVARNLAYACAEWFEASPEERKILQVTATPPPRAATEQSKDIEMHESTSQLHSHATPELVASGEADSPVDDADEEFRITIADTVSPTAIFALQDDDVVFGLSRSPATDKLLEELPMYGVPLKVPRYDLPTSDIDPDRYWKRPAVPISKYVEGRMELKTSGPPHKKDRFEYEEDSEDEDATPDQSGPRRPHLPPEQTDVGLFDPANKHIRDRIHAGHQFRPPSEFPMPLQSFFENRPSSQWTYAEDDELKKLVREYSYNCQRVEKRRNQKHLTLVDAMRKLAKKRENTLQKQQLSAAQAAARKNNEQQPQNWAPIKTPQEFSKLKYDREEQMKERMAAFQLRQEQQRREIQARARNANQQQVLPNGLPQRVPSLPNGLAPPNGLPNGNGHLAVPGQNRARPLQQMGVPGPMPNSLRIPQAMANGVPQAPMQGGLPINPSMTADLAENARRVSMQQRQAILQRQQQQGSPHPSQPQNSPPRISGMPSQLGGFMPNNMIGYNAANASGMATSPGVSTPPAGQVGSPRIGLPMPGVPNGGLPLNIPYQEIEKMDSSNVDWSSHLAALHRAR
ncbi:chromatin modification VID21 protein [Rutstroemia sp. NJR-2017a BVV2]|nr:chromatin modification VID21 protein [Rutstroemia sp. NJR-2017a BVV2]